MLTTSQKLIDLSPILMPIEIIAFIFHLFQNPANCYCQTGNQIWIKEYDTIQILRPSLKIMNECDKRF